MSYFFQLKDELTDYAALIEAEATLSGLLEDRAILKQQLDELKRDPETAEGEQVKMLEEDIELRSLQIQDLQQKLLDSNEGTGTKILCMLSP